MLWVDGVEVFDVVASETFMMHAMLFCTINDFLAYGNLSGYSIKGRQACPICEENTASHQLKNGRKTMYLCHRRFSKAPTPLTDIQIHEKVNKVHNSLKSKKSEKSFASSPWKKKSIFFDLPYWSKLQVRHCIDVIHVKKNVCDSLIGTLTFRERQKIE